MGWWCHQAAAGPTLSYDDVAHYGKIVVALKETVRLMAEIDEAIPSWPIEWSRDLGGLS